MKFSLWNFLYDHLIIWSLWSNDHFLNDHFLYEITHLTLQFSLFLFLECHLFTSYFQCKFCWGIPSFLPVAVSSHSSCFLLHLMENAGHKNNLLQPLPSQSCAFSLGVPKLAKDPKLLNYSHIFNVNPPFSFSCHSYCWDLVSETFFHHSLRSVELGFKIRLLFRK